LRQAWPLAAALAGCGGPVAPPEEEIPAAPSTAIESEDVIAGARPVLHLRCADRSGSFWLALIRTPDPTPGARGTFGAVKVDDGAPVRIELAWLGADRWAPRLDHQAEARLVAAMLQGRNVYFAGPEGMTYRAYRWDLARLGSHLDTLRAACG
jgi:hypothetical protein